MYRCVFCVECSTRRFLAYLVVATRANTCGQLRGRSCGIFECCGNYIIYGRYAFCLLGLGAGSAGYILCSFSCLSQLPRSFQIYRIGRMVTRAAIIGLGYRPSIPRFTSPVENALGLCHIRRIRPIVHTGTRLNLVLFLWYLFA